MNYQQTYVASGLALLAEESGTRQEFEEVFNNMVSEDDAVKGMGEIILHQMANPDEFPLKSVLEWVLSKNVYDEDNQMNSLVAGVQALQGVCHGNASEAGWWHDLDTGEALINRPHIIGEKIALIHSEVSEAMEGHRKNLMDDKLPHRKMVEVELADAIIRIADLAGAMNLDLAGAIQEKLEFNKERPDHKVENRKKSDGKKY